MTPPDDSTLWDAIGAVVVGGISGFISSWMRDRIKMAKLEATVNAFMAKSDERHHDNQEATRENRKAIEKVADSVVQLGRELRNGWREKGH